MIQVTKWLEPDELVYYKNRYIAVKKWIYIEAERIQSKVNVKTIVRSNNNNQLSIFRNKLR
tara:strand:- start:942 stop:1124 length:183 start_codon:yes stop_codon:yes gene_type:complete